MKIKSQTKIISMISSPSVELSCGGQGCRIYTLPFIELKPWDGNRKNTERKAA